MNRPSSGSASAGLTSEPPSDSEAPLSPGAKSALGVALLSVFIGALDLTVIATILPRMIVDLEINSADVDRYIWIVNGYLLAYVVAIPIMGRVSDLIGRLGAFQIALSVFLVGSIWCAVATSLPALIAGRAVQGAGGGALLPVTMALVADLLPRSRRGTALGLVGAVDTLGWVLGPIWGAAIVGILASQAEAWRWVFIVHVPLGLAAAVAIAYIGRRRLPRIQRHHVSLDILGTLLLALSLFLLNLGLSSGGEVGGTTGTGLRALGGTTNPLAPYLLPLLIGALLVGIMFIWWEKRVAHPVLPVDLFRRRPFTAAVTANFIVGAALIVAMVDVPVLVALLVTEERVSTSSALLLAPFTLVMAVLSLLGGFAATRRGERATAGMGLILVAIGYIALWIGMGQDDSRFVAMLPGLVLSGAGFGLVIAPLGASVINAAPAANRGIAAALTLVFRLLGMTVGISALTAMGVRRLQALTGRLDPIVQAPGEGTAEFLARQQRFIEDHAIPLSVQVLRETFLAAALLALIALLPVRLMRDSTPPPATQLATDERRAGHVRASPLGARRR